MKQTFFTPDWCEWYCVKLWLALSGVNSIAGLSGLYSEVIVVVVVADIRPSAGGEGGHAAVPGYARQPRLVAALPVWHLLLHHDVHRLQCASHRALPQVHPPQTGFPVRRGERSGVLDPQCLIQVKE